MGWKVYAVLPLKYTNIKQHYDFMVDVYPNNPLKINQVGMDIQTFTKQITRFHFTHL